MPPDGQDPDTDAATKPFAAVLQEQRDGAFHTELSEKFAELVQRCMETGKKGHLNIKLTCSPQKDEVTMLVTGDVKASVPEPDVRPSLFWPDAQGNLLRSDPRQLDLGSLREVPKPAAKEVKAG